MGRGREERGHRTRYSRELHQLSSGPWRSPHPKAPMSSRRVGLGVAFTELSLTRFNTERTAPVSALESHKHLLRKDDCVCLTADTRGRTH